MTAPVLSPPQNRFALKLAAVALVVATIGLPINRLSEYVPLLAATVIIFSGAMRTTPRAWLSAILIVGIAIAGQLWLATPRIDEGHNVFRPGPPGNVLERGLPGEVYARLREQFDAQYPPSVRCRPEIYGCWQSQGFPDRVYAFSADGIFNPSPLSRSVTGISFDNPIWLRLGFGNEVRYNWYSEAPDVHRAVRNRQFWKGYDRWQFAMPWFETIIMPAAMAGGELCWRGDVMWEEGDGKFSSLPGERCRTIEASDAGKRIFGLAIKPDSLAMHFTPPPKIRLMNAASWALMLAAVFGIVISLVRVDLRRAALPFTAIALAAAAIAVDDASFLGGLRPLDGGDDGLFYDGVGRVILEKMQAGDVFGALQGGEAVFYYGGPGLRYFRALEHAIFGETFFGFLSLLLLFPIVVYFVFRRFLTPTWALVLGFCFLALPIGMLFGTSFANYAKWANRGYADPMAYMLFIMALLPLTGFSAAGPQPKFWTAFSGALLLALAIFMKPIVAPAAGILLGGVGLAALYRRQWSAVAGMIIGFLPVLSMPLHNWVYGGRLVLFSDNAGHPLVYVMPPSAWIAALREVVTFDFSGGFAQRALLQIPNWLSGTAGSWWTAPVNAAMVVMLVYVVVRGRGFDPWLRLIGAAALAQHMVAFFYVATPRYHYLTWFLTLLVAAVFVQQVGLPWLERRYPAVMGRLTRLLWPPRLAAGMGWLAGKGLKAKE